MALPRSATITLGIGAVVLIALIAFFIITQAAPKADVISLQGDTSSSETIDNGDKNLAATSGSNVASAYPVFAVIDLGKIINPSLEDDHLVSGLNDKGIVTGNSNYKPLIATFAYPFKTATTEYFSGNTVGINNSNQIISESTFIIANNKVQRVTPPKGAYNDNTFLIDINNKGEFIAKARVNNNYKTYRYKITNGLPVLDTTFTPIDFAGVDSNDKSEIISENEIWTPAGGKQKFGPDGYLATAINNRGIVVGSASFNEPWILKGGNGPKALGKLDDCPNSQIGGTARDINEKNQIVGQSNGCAFLYTDAKGPRNLNTMIPKNSGWTLEKAMKINKLGMIAGIGKKNSELHGFLLIPQGSEL